MDVDDQQDSKIMKLEERVNSTERELAALTSKLQFIQDDLSRRIIDINNNLKEDAEATRIDLRERINDLRSDLKEDIGQVTESISNLDASITILNSSLHSLYISQTGSSVKVNVNEKIIWTIVALIGTSGLYLLQDIVKGATG